MSMSDSDSSQSGDFQTFRQITRERLLYEMLRSTKVKDSKSAWKVLIMDKVTVKIMSYSCKMVDITEEGVSLVEDLSKRRQPLPTMDAIYFIQPTKENVVMFLSDMSGRSPLYRKAFVFFSSPIHKELVAQIKKETRVLPRIGALSEMNLEYFAIDSQGFVTDHEKALEELFGENVEGSHKYNACLNTMATRIATAFASLREYPYVRYRAAKSSLDVSTVTTLHDLVPTKLAAAVWNCLAKYKCTIPDFPQRETCELLIVDRTIDQIAPIIHEWTYDAMCHDLLNMDGNKYIYEVQVETKDGKTETEKKEVLLEDHDPIWLELRHAHIAYASERLHEKMTNFITRNKAAQIHHSSRDHGELSTRDLQKVVQALPNYGEQIDKLSLHVELARLSADDMNAVNSMRYLGRSDTKKTSRGFFSLKFDVHRKKHAVRKERNDEEKTWQLSRFYPMIEELIEKLGKGELPKDEYPCMNDPSPTFLGTSQSVPVRTAHFQPAHSMRSRRTATWARPRNSDDGYSSDSILRHASSDCKRMGQRIFIFVIGGMTRSELHVVHKLTSKLNREVILGASSLDDPPKFITKMKMMSAQELSLDDLQL
uniref:SNARE-interacting protein KEULE isoform X5 n=1 Tax=Elaeis guineensis var. tenera TaxID=51953 RepID=A0A8N4IB87_ELAGV|nr:SNARE-interacting protein KEULE isoform X5 [Elaeis guineensis]